MDIDDKTRFTVEWSDDFVTGNEIIDNSHKEIIKGIKELYAMCEDTKKYLEEIPAATDKMVKMLMEHFDEEEELFKKYDLSCTDEHIKNHEEYRDELENLVRFDFPALMKALMINEILVRYLTEHFLIYDKKSIEELNKKLKENA